MTQFTRSDLVKKRRKEKRNYEKSRHHGIIPGGNG